MTPWNILLPLASCRDSAPIPIRAAPSTINGILPEITPIITLARPISIIAICITFCLITSMLFAISSLILSNRDTPSASVKDNAPTATIAIPMPIKTGLPHMKPRITAARPARIVITCMIFLLTAS